ncbi:uncharacterized protein BDZ99DRAFT_103436 [Mytilinidion resinicola]|uniref:Uncharacterized protein n=1 Tax=Mytilinidion resinicola TaxID=574789 RepID=A0A6A6YB78_9PEZI|nr:uncharacterized protein BDZ99DRAFT_103436 [Mytilinidion resinicola]KAF2806071.1 hypothetical protein BDZ99DRAFT_103436 [Mytilinidion resinicola]
MQYHGRESSPTEMSPPTLTTLPAEIRQMIVAETISITISSSPLATSRPSAPSANSSGPTSSSSARAGCPPPPPSSSWRHTPPPAGPPSPRSTTSSARVQRS